MTERDGPAPSGDYLAAVDLGSNSFHMLIARLMDGEPVVIDRLREPVRLAWGLDGEDRLTDEAKARAIATLERFGQRVRHLAAGRVRAVGTNTLRRAHKAGKFRRAAEAALGHPIEIISGREEARLLYLGVAHSLPDDLEPRLVVDIGGGSTELILGERFEAFETHSFHMGCVSFTRRYFPDGVLRRKHMERAMLAARSEIQTIERRFRDLGWGRAVGASGTVRAVDSILHANGWSDDGITPDGLKRLRKALVAAGNVADLALDGLSSSRAPVLPGGVAILSAVFDALDLERMHAASGALREGLMYDLLGRIRHEDVRERTIRLFQERYGVDRRQAARVERNALAFLEQAAPGWDLDRPRCARLLMWASRLHEVGLAVSYSGYHRHGAYLLRYADMPGFSRDDQNLLAVLVGGHRRKVRSELFADLPSDRRMQARQLAALLRLAVLTNRERGPHPIPPFCVTGREAKLVLRWPEGWLARHPLTRLDFEQEAAYLMRIGLQLDAAPEA